MNYYIHFKLKYLAQNNLVVEIGSYTKNACISGNQVSTTLHTFKVGNKIIKVQHQEERTKERESMLGVLPIVCMCVSVCVGTYRQK